MVTAALDTQAKGLAFAVLDYTRAVDKHRKLKTLSFCKWTYCDDCNVSVGCAMEQQQQQQYHKLQRQTAQSSIMQQ